MKNKQFEEFIKKGIECKIDKNNPDSFNFSLIKGKGKIEFISDVSKSKIIADSGLLDYKLIDGYEAIFSQRLGIIECQLGNFYEYEYESLCESLTNYKLEFNLNEEQTSEPPLYLSFKNNFNVKISIGYYSKPFKKLLELKHDEYEFKRQNKLTIKISLNKLKKHDEAKKVLEEIGNSALFEININYQTSITLQQDKPNTKRNNFEYIIDKEMALAIDNDLDDLQIIYPSEPTSYFLKANIMHDLKFYQFLLFYHCLEYYFPQYSYLYLKDPIDKVLKGNSNNNIKKNGVVNEILDVIRNKSKVEREEDVLKVLINCSFDESIEDINFYINNQDRLKEYFITSTEYNAISKKPIYGSDKIISLDKIALRIYDIRCAIVHKKNDPKKDKLYPNLRTFELIKHDNELLKYIAENIIKKHAIQID